MLRLPGVSLLAPLLLLHALCSAQDDSINTHDADRSHSLCKSYFARGEIGEAIRFGKQSVELDQGSSDYYLWLGIAYSEKTKSGFFLKKLSNARKSKSAFEKGVELNPASADAREGLLEFYVRAPGIAGGSFDKAKEEAAAISEIDPVRGRLAYAYIRQREEDFAGAEHELLQAVEVDSTQTEPYFRLGSFYWNQEEFDKAETAYLMAVENCPGEMKACFELGWFYRNRDKHAEACQAFQKILAVKPDDMNALFFLASSFLDQGELESADEIVSRIRNTNPEQSGVSFLMAKRALVSEKELLQGTEYLDKYLEVELQEMYHPSWSYSHLMAGIESYGPIWAEARLILGLIREKLGDKKRAKKEFERALKLDPALEKAKEALEQLDHNR